MTGTDDTQPTVEEQYLTAAHTSNLRVVAEKRGAGDVLIAMAWSPSRVGAALIRLHGEWDGAEKRPRMSETDLILLRAKLKSLASVLGQVAMHMGRRGMDDPEGRAGQIVGYWLSQVCPACHGLQFQLIRDTPTLGTLRCRSCHGTGKIGAPCGEDGRAVLNWLDSCVGAARASLRARLRP